MPKSQARLDKRGIEVEGATVRVLCSDSVLTVRPVGRHAVNLVVPVAKRVAILIRMDNHFQKPLCYLAELQMGEWIIVKTPMQLRLGVHRQRDVAGKGNEVPIATKGPQLGVVCGASAVVGVGDQSFGFVLGLRRSRPQCLHQ